MGGDNAKKVLTSHKKVNLEVQSIPRPKPLETHLGKKTTKAPTDIAFIPPEDNPRSHLLRNQAVHRKTPTTLNDAHHLLKAIKSNKNEKARKNKAKEYIGRDIPVRVRIGKQTIDTRGRTKGVMSSAHGFIHTFVVEVRAGTEGIIHGERQELNWTAVDTKIFQLQVSHSELEILHIGRNFLSELITPDRT